MQSSSKRLRQEGPSWSAATPVLRLSSGPLAVMAFCLGLCIPVSFPADLVVPDAAPMVGYSPRPPGQLTFSKNIAPILFEHCAVCHRPGQSAPFPLLTYGDAKKHALDLAKVTRRRYMPPWLPEPGYGEFAGERRLTVDQIGMISQWAAEGQAEGLATDLPQLPHWAGDWQLGVPDLILTLPQPYNLAAEGRDVYRNFVLPAPISSPRYVRGVEFHPGNARIVHHAFVKVDRTAQSRRLDAQDAEPGFSGMNSPAEMPDGHFLGWQPGRLAAFVPEGLAWRLDPGNDLVVQAHLQPSGKPESLQFSVGLYFTDHPATNRCFKIALSSLVIDVPAGAQDYVVEDDYTLPIDVQVLAVLPHAHYLAKTMEGWATLPDGTRKSLLLIKRWDFNWQGDYRYATPVELPRGTKLSMRFVYDNSTNNVFNPNNPPHPVSYGPQSKDEMAELWFQLLPRDPGERPKLAADYDHKMTALFAKHRENEVRKDPNNAPARAELGMLRLSQGNRAEAEQHFRLAIQSKPEYAPAHYDYGVLLRLQGRLAEAQAQFETTLRLDPKNSKAHGNLGYVLLDRGDRRAAQAHFESALEIDPDDPLAKAGLAKTKETAN